MTEKENTKREQKEERKKEENIEQKWTKKATQPYITYTLISQQKQQKKIFSFPTYILLISHKAIYHKNILLTTSQTFPHQTFPFHPQRKKNLHILFLFFSKTSLYFVCATPPIQYGSSTAELLGGVKSFLDFIQLSLFYLDPIVQRDERVRASASRSGNERTNQRTRYTGSLSVSGKPWYDPFSDYVLTLYSTPKPTTTYFCNQI